MTSHLVKLRVQQAWNSATLRTISGLAGGNLVATAVALVGTLVQARFVTPSDLGYFRSFGIVSGYAYFLQLGLIDAVARYYPYYMGKREEAKALRITEICQAWNAAVPAVFSAAFIVLAMGALLQGNAPASLAWLTQVVVITVSIYGGYLGATYRSGHDFATLARSSVLSSVATLATLPLFLFTPFVALAMRTGVAGAVNLTYLQVRRPLRLPWRFNFTEWRDLVKNGLPLFIASYGYYTLWAVVETTVVLKLLGSSALGLWAMSSMLFEASNKIPQAINLVYKPRLIETYGRTESTRAGLKLCKKPLLLGAPAMLLLAAVAIVVIRFTVPILMPRYVAAIPSACLMMLELPMTVLELPNSLLTASGKIKQQNIAVYVGLGSFVLMALATYELRLGLLGIVGASLLGRTICLGLIYLFVYISSLREQRQ